ncbi:MAG TPA: hypothetical protein ENL20_01675 [Candidatus Cloacimonetes bacterium]|nr:hypothetical protein [Candidatus Cloacimonadota bacterium]
MKKIFFISLLVFITVSAYAEFDIKKFSNPYKYNWDTTEKQHIYRENLMERQKLLQVYQLKKQNITTNLIKSAIAPGWGHFSARSYTKGQILLGLELAILGTSLYYYDISMEQYDKYKKATYIEDINQYYSNAKMPYIYSQGLLGLGIVIWIYTVYDTIAVTEEYNQNLWQEIFFDFQQKKISITPTGITLRF